MKRIAFASFVLALSMFSITSCTKSSSSDSSSTSGTLTATVDGSSWAATTGIIATKSSIGGNTTLSVSGKKVDGSQLNIGITNFTGNGTYTIDNTIVAEYGKAGSSGTVSLAVSGEIDVTNSSGNAVGTFHFVTMDSTLVTSGSFDIPIY